MKPGLRLDAERLALRAGGLHRARLLFNSLSLQLVAGQRWVVLGPNGAGKSSLLAALAGVMPLAGGGVRLQGRALVDWPAPELAQWRAWCPQFWSDPFPATVGETARLARDRGAWWRAPTRETDSAADESRVQRVLAQLELLPLADADVRRLSGGERQRVAVATTVLQDAPLLLLDEPASHMDLAHQHRLLALLQEHTQGGGTVVVSLHDLNLAWELASHVVLLDGRGGARCGEREALMQPALLSDVFGVAIEQARVGERQRFWVGVPEQLIAGRDVAPGALP